LIGIDNLIFATLIINPIAMEVFVLNHLDQGKNLPSSFNSVSEWTGALSTLLIVSLQWLSYFSHLSQSLSFLCSVSWKKDLTLV
jgi:hypothetical protein